MKFYIVKLGNLFLMGSHDYTKLTFSIAAKDAYLFSQKSHAENDADLCGGDVIEFVSTKELED